MKSIRIILIFFPTIKTQIIYISLVLTKEQIYNFDNFIESSFDRLKEICHNFSSFDFSKNPKKQTKRKNLEMNIDFLHISKILFLNKVYYRYSFE